MPAAWAVVAKLGLVLAIILTLGGLLRWVLKRAEDKRHAEDQVKELEANLARSEAARNKELQIADAVRKVNTQPGPTVPDLGGVRGGTHRPGPPP